MDTISQEFAILPGVIGSCVSDRNKGISFSSMPDFFTTTMAQEAHNNIGRMLQMASVKGLTPQTMSIRYDKFFIIARPINSDTMLLILSEPGSNTSLISTTANMLAPEIEKTLEQTSVPVAEVVTPEPVKEDEPEQDQSSEQTSEALNSIKEALFDTVGPVADMVYDECFNRWIANHPPDISRIFELVGCISVEIDNPNLFDEFKEKISTLL